MQTKSLPNNWKIGICSAEYCDRFGWWSLKREYLALPGRYCSVFTPKGRTDLWSWKIHRKLQDLSKTILVYKTLLPCVVWLTSRPLGPWSALPGNFAARPTPRDCVIAINKIKLSSSKEEVRKWSLHWWKNKDIPCRNRNACHIPVVSIRGIS